jgi:3-oxoacyl-[acyl-carrier protein] reductase
MGRFDGRVAVVTGAARGIGFGTATRFAEEGASVAILDLDEAAASEAAGRLPLTDGAKAVGIGADVSNGASAEAAVARVVEELGGIHILVNNAGITRDNLLFKMSEEDWDLVMGVHLKGAFLMTKTA